MVISANQELVYVTISVEGCLTVKMTRRKSQEQIIVVGNMIADDPAHFLLMKQQDILMVFNFFICYLGRILIKYLCTIGEKFSLQNEKGQLF